MRTLPSLVLPALLAALIGGLSFTAQADERFGAFLVPDSMPDAILLVDDITNSAPSDFRRALKAQPKARILVLGSNGGVVGAAIKLASAVRQHGLNTAIPRKFGCYSACAYVYFAGKEHAVGGELGVHRASTGDSRDGAASAAYFDSVRGQLARFDIPEAVMERMVETPPSSMHVFTRREIRDLALTRTSGPKSRTAILAAR